MPGNQNPQTRNPEAGATPTIRQAHWVGNINKGLPNDGYVGCKAVYFPTLKAMNAYFSDDGEGAGMLLVEATYRPRWWGAIGVIALVTNQLDPEEMEEMTQASRAIEAQMAEWRERRRLAKLEDEQAKQAAQQEMQRLARLGAHCENNHKK